MVAVSSCCSLHHEHIYVTICIRYLIFKINFFLKTTVYLMLHFYHYSNMPMLTQRLLTITSEEAEFTADILFEFKTQQIQDRGLSTSMYRKVKNFP